MRKIFLATALVVILIPWLLAGEEAVKILPMEIPAAQAPGGTTIWVALSRLQALGDELTADVPAADMALLNAQGAPLVTLGSLKKGKWKWEHKTVQDKFLAVKLAAADYVPLAERLKAGTPQTGLQIGIIDAVTQAVIRSFPVAGGDFADLAVQLNYPVQAAPGQPLRQEVSVNLANLGSVAARNVKLEIVLSGDDRVPLRAAPASAGFCRGYAP